MIEVVSIGATLFAISTLEGVRRVPVGSFIARRIGFAEWTVARVESSATFRLVSWCIPVVLPIVLNPVRTEGSRLPLRRLTRRVESRGRRAQSSVVVARVIGMLGLLVLSIGLPFATQFAGPVGFVAGLLALEALCVCQVVLTARTLKRLGMTGSAATLASLPFLNPFASHRAVEVILRQVVADAPPALVISALVSDEHLRTGVRRFLYDSLNARVAGEDATLLLELLGSQRLSRILSSSDECEHGAAFCPRCGSVFRSAGTQCSDCREVALLSCVSQKHVAFSAPAA
jgi:hypothetical protein